MKKSFGFCIMMATLCIGSSADECVNIQKRRKKEPLKDLYQPVFEGCKKDLGHLTALIDVITQVMKDILALEDALDGESRNELKECKEYLTGLEETIKKSKNDIQLWSVKINKFSQ